jgi:hypothetical protein
MKFLFILCLVGSFLFFEGCKKETSPPEQKEGGTQEDSQVRERRMEREKDEMYRRMKEQLDRTDRKIEELKAEAKKSGKYDDPKFRDRIDRLEKKEINIRVNVDKIKNASLAAWEDLKPRVAGALDDLFDGVEKAISEFRFSQRKSPPAERKQE